MTESPATYRRRRALAIVGLAAAAALLTFLVSRLTGSDAAEPPRGGGSAERAQAKLAELPRGGRSILPKFRVVAYYGAPQDRQLGALGIGTPTHAAKRLQKQAEGYARKSRPVLPAMELIAVVAAAHPGQGGRYSMRQPDATIVLDIQPALSDLFTQTRRLRKWLKEPDVGLPLDPEWRMAPGQIP